jgi:DNA-binding CsgD family transcriptional regulator
VIVAADGSLISTTPAGDRWLQELGHPEPEKRGLPAEIHVLAAQLRQPNLPPGAEPCLRMRTQAGRWAALHASRLPAGESDSVAVIIEEPTAMELAPVLMAAYRLTKQERNVTQLVCHGLSTREIAEHLRITGATVQDHLKSIFDKTGVRSRRELVTVILREQYLPRIAAETPVGPSGFFLD